MSNRIINGKLIYSKNAFRDIVDLVVRKQDNIFPTKKDNTYINVIYSDKLLELIVKINVKKDIDVSKLSEHIQKEIYDNIYQMTGIKTSNINIEIQGFEC